MHSSPTQSERRVEGVMMGVVTLVRAPLDPPPGDPLCVNRPISARRASYPAPTEAISSCSPAPMPSP